MDLWGVEKLAEVDVSSIVDWIKAVPLSDWPMQSKPGEPLIPSMMTDLAWHDFGAKTDSLVANLMLHFPSCRSTQRMLSVVMPGEKIREHVDVQRPEWISRVHAPLTTNPQALFVANDVVYNLLPGVAYKVNTYARHSVSNMGECPRIHFMFDVLKG